jgi:hypothetical protein
MKKYNNHKHKINFFKNHGKMILIFMIKKLKMSNKKGLIFIKISKG